MEFGISPILNLAHAQFFLTRSVVKLVLLELTSRVASWNDVNDYSGYVVLIWFFLFFFCFLVISGLFVVLRICPFGHMFFVVKLTTFSNNYDMIHPR